MEIKVEIQGCDEIKVILSGAGDIQSMQSIACSQTTSLIAKYRQEFGLNLSNWPLPSEKDHSSLLLKELILKFQNKWQSPYADDEICHCRKVRTQTVENAILLGARSSEEVSRLTNASTSCGSCKFDVEKLIEYRVG